MRELGEAGEWDEVALHQLPRGEKGLLGRKHHTLGAKPLPSLGG
jgi:hypothetical protein